MDPTTNKLKAMLLKDWERLVYHVVDRRFRFAYSTAETAHNSLRRPCDRDDLIQEGWLALLEAIDCYDPKHASGASLKSYAYRAIVNRLCEFVNQMSSPMKMGKQWDVAHKGSEFAKARRSAAQNCLMFSEIEDTWDLNDGDSPLDVAHRPAGGSPAEQPDAQFVKDDFVQHCLKKLRANLDPDDYTLLEMRANGAKLAEIAAKLGVAVQTASRRLRKVRAQARVILGEEANES